MRVNKPGQNPNERAERKLGPRFDTLLLCFDFVLWNDVVREIGKNHSFEVPDYEWDQDTDFLKERVAEVDLSTNAFGEKLGPVQIGMNKEYQIADYDNSTTDSGSDFLSER